MTTTKPGSENRQESAIPPSPSPFKDISNHKTPKPKLSFSRTFQSTSSTTKTPQFFTASKKTPSYSLSTAKRHRTSASAMRRLKAFELEQSQSSRKEEIKKERSMKSLAKSLTAWLNFLFENPISCGCDDQGELKDGVESVRSDGESGRKRERSYSGGGGGGVNGGWRLPKRVRGKEEVEVVRSEGDLSRSKKFVYLRNSMKEVCSLDDLEERMRGYLSFDSCKEVFNVMTQVSKTIDEGRLKMRTHCPIVTDVGMRQKAVKVLMCYNPAWLQIGLHIIFGGESLLPNEDNSSEQDISFLKMVIEKQLFSHAALARAYAYNKLVDGVYRPGYFETLGNVILKRFLLLVLILDRGKTQSSLPIKYGIDGLDGGSPLLFNLHSNIKSSRQMINDFLTSDVMHGEGNLLAHLVILGYKVFYQQGSLIEYDFRMTDLFQDIQDGVRICRAIQLLRRDTSILAKLVLPADTHKKKIANCSIALEYLKLAGVSLHDDDGMVIGGEDIASGDKEVILSLLWNMFVQLQLPLLITKATLSEEISSICKTDTEFKDAGTSSHLDMLQNWMKTICRNYDMEMESLASLVDGKAMWCLLDFYFRKELHCPGFMKGVSGASEESIVSMRDATDAVHNFVLSQKLTTLLGNFPEVLQICEILEHKGACNERSVIILLVFLSSQLLVKKSKDQLNFHKLLGCHCQTPERKRWSLSSDEFSKQREQSAEDAAQKFKAVKAWWQEMSRVNVDCVSDSAAAGNSLFSDKNCIREIPKVNAVIIIQSHIRRVLARKRYMKMKQAVSCLQLYMHAWLISKQILKSENMCASIIQEKCKRLDGLARGITFMVNRHKFVKQKGAALLIQKAARAWISQRCHKKGLARTNGREVCSTKRQNERQRECALKIQLAWRQFLASDGRQKQHVAATIIQSHVRALLLQRRFLNLKQAALQIQSSFRSLRSLKYFHEYRVATKSATVIQSHTRGWIARRDALHHTRSIIMIQSHCRCWLARRSFLCQKVAASKIQGALRVMMCHRAFKTFRHSAIEIQRFVRGRISRARLVGASSLHVTASRHFTLTLGNGLYSTELKIVMHAIVKLQRWWKNVLSYKLKKAAAVCIQSHIRGSHCRQRLTKERKQAVTIQAHWKGYLARKYSKKQLIDLRLRIQNSAATVEDSMRIMNRLVAALKELKSMKNVSGILHNCATLDLATMHSQKCCERLVDEGAIPILLYQIRAVTRSIPDQQVLKHCLSTLRNLARYAYIADLLIDHQELVETVLRELLRNKEEGYYIACQLLRKLCTRPGGNEAIRKLPLMLKRLRALVEDLTRKVNQEKRNLRNPASRDASERRLKEVSVLLNLITHG